MYIKMRLLIFTGCLISLVSNAISAERKFTYMECTPKHILSCESEKNTCENIPVANIEGEYIIKVNLKKKISETFEGSQKVSGSKIERIEYHAELIFLTGYREEQHGERVRHSWTAIVDTKTGRLTFASVANGLGFMLSGHCTDAKGGKT